MSMSRLTFGLLLLFSLLPLTGCAIDTVMRVENREVIGVKTMIEELHGAPLIFLGERHDAPAHHELQLEVIKAIKAEGRPLVIGMEMFENISQPALNAWSSGAVPEEAFRKVFEWNWRNIPYSLYRDVLIYARDHKIPILALNAPRQVVQKVSKSGFASLSAEDLLQLPKGVDAEVSDAYLDFISSSYAVHGRNGEFFRRLCEAQMLRNRVMATRITDYFAEHPDTVMVVIAGGGHARGRGGVPAELRLLPYKIVLPPIPTMTADTVNGGDADYLLEEPVEWPAGML